MNKARYIRGLIGTVSSIIASIIIFLILIIVYKNDVGAAFEPPAIYCMVSLIVVGLAAYYGYTGYARKARWWMRNISPIALALGVLAIVGGVKWGPVAGGSLVVLSYVVELGVGARLAKDFEAETVLGSRLFLVGVTLFIIGLPLAFFTNKLIIISIIGTIVKTVGLILILARQAEKARGAA